MAGTEEQEPSPVERERSLTNTIVRGAGLAGSGFVLGQALYLAAYIVLARLLTPTEFGTFAAGTILLGLALLVSEAGISAAVVQRRDRVDEAMATAVLATAANGLGLSLVALATAPLVGLIFDASEVTAIAAAMAGIVFLRGLASVPNAVLQRRFSFVRRVAIEPLVIVAFGAGAIIAASNDMGAWSLVVGQYAATVTDVIASWAFARWWPQLRKASWAMWRELVSFGRHVFAATVIQQAGQQSDAIIVGPLLGTAPLGQFRYGHRLATLPYQAVLAAAAFVLYPAFSRISHDAPRMRPAVTRSLHWICLIAVPLGMLLIPLGEPLAVIVFGEVWRDAGQAAAAMGPYTAAAGFTAVVAEALKAFGRPDRLTPLFTLSVVATAALMLALVPLGLTAVAAGISGGAVIGALYALKLSRDVLELDPKALAARIVPLLIAGLIAAGAVWLTESRIDSESHGPLASLALVGAQGLAGCAIFAVLASFSKPSRSELRGALGSVAARLKRG